jgi:VWFA-related protein
MARSVGGITTILAISLLAQQPRQPPPTIRSRTTLVPIDIRVVDLSGNPVKDLKKEDFTVLEDGIRQEIRLFEAHALTAEAPRPGRPALRKAQSADAPPAAQNQRIFLFVFGRGRLQWPDKGIDSTIHFVRDRLMPQDRVAVLAYNRATDFTTDRASIATTLERFRNSHARIEALMAQQFSGLQAIYGRKGPPNKDIQAEIDRVFHAPGTAGARRLPPGTPTDDALIAADTRRDVDTLQRAELLAGRQQASPFDAFDRDAAAVMDTSFDQYAKESVQTFQDLGNIYAGINYLKYLDGEKHLVFVSESGLFLPRLDNDHSIAALASDARVVVDTLQTGGVITMDPFQRSPMGGIVGWNANAVGRMSVAQMNAGQTMRNLAELTGGMAAVYTPSEKTLAKVDSSSRFQYLLGYAPTRATWDGKFRRVKVTVNRKDVKVLHRHGYYAREEYVPFDRRQFMTYSRIASAGNMDEPLTDLKVTATADYVKGAAQISVNVTLTADRVAFEHANGRHAASLEVAYFVGSAKQALIGEHWQAVDLDLTDANYETFKSKGASYTQRLAVKGEPAFVKVIVYDYAADLTGTTLVVIRPGT